MSLRIVSSIFWVNTTDNVNDADVSDILFVEKRIIRNLIKVERCAIESTIFAREVMNIGGIHGSEAAKLCLVLHACDCRETEEVLTIGADLHKSDFKEPQVAALETVLKHGEIRTFTIADRRSERQSGIATITEASHTISAVWDSNGILLRITTSCHACARV